MNARLYFSTDRSAPTEPIEELSVVSLKKSFEADGRLIPEGSKGTVVSVYASGVSYCVEFEAPFHALITVDCEFIDPVAGESRADLALSVGAADR